MSLASGSDVERKQIPTSAQFDFESLLVTLVYLPFTEQNLKLEKVTYEALVMSLADLLKLMKDLGIKLLKRNSYYFMIEIQLFRAISISGTLF